MSSDVKSSAIKNAALFLLSCACALLYVTLVRAGLRVTVDIFGNVTVALMKIIQVATVALIAAIITMQVPLFFRGVGFKRTAALSSLALFAFYYIIHPNYPFLFVMFSVLSHFDTAAAMVAMTGSPFLVAFAIQRFCDARETRGS